MDGELVTLKKSKGDSRISRMVIYQDCTMSTHYQDISGALTTLHES